MPAYLFIKTKIHDPEQYAKYATEVRELAARWHSRYIVRSRPVEVLEGSAEQWGDFLPKLLLHLSEGFLIDRWKVEWMRSNLPDLRIHDMGPGGHFMQEFNPEGIGTAIAMWMDEGGL